jgi:hypothetical protein
MFLDRTDPDSLSLGPFATILYKRTPVTMEKPREGVKRNLSAKVAPMNIKMFATIEIVIK